MLIDLLPSRPYSVSDPAALQSLGLALDRQAGADGLSAQDGEYPTRIIHQDRRAAR